MNTQLNKDTIKSDIVHYLEEQGGWVFGGVLGRTLRELTGHKESIIERRARELVNEGKILNAYEQIEGRGPRCVKYRIKPTPDELFNIQAEQNRLEVANFAKFPLGSVDNTTSHRQLTLV